MLVNNNTLCHTTNLLVIITNNADHKICIPEEITIGTSEGINEDEYDRNEITLIKWSNTSNIINSFQSICNIK